MILFSPVAQRLERLAYNKGAGGSTPPGTTIFLKFYITKTGGIWHRCCDNAYRSYYQLDGKCGGMYTAKFCIVQIPTILIFGSYYKPEKIIYTEKLCPAVTEEEFLKDIAVKSIEIDLS